MGWARSPNRELLVEQRVDDGLRDFEEQILSESIAVTEEIMERLSEIEVDSSPLVGGDFVEVSNSGGGMSLANEWYPRTRDPALLLTCLRGARRISSESRERLAWDLAGLGVPVDTPEVVALPRIRSELMRHGLFAQMISRAERDRGLRFGEAKLLAREWLAEREGALDSMALAQNVYRWLTFFFSDQFKIRRLPHSEILFRVRERGHH